MQKDLIKDEWPYNIKFQQFATFLGLTTEKDAKGVKWPHGDLMAKKVEDLYLWGKINSNSIDDDDIKKAVFDLQRRIGVNWIGKSLIDKLWQHVKFDTKVKPTEKQIESLRKKEREIEKESTNVGEEVKIATGEKGEALKGKPPSTIQSIAERNVAYEIRKENEIIITNKRTRALVSEPLDMEETK